MAESSKSAEVADSLVQSMKNPLSFLTGLSKTSVILIAVGTFIFLLQAFGIAFYFLRRHRNREKAMMERNEETQQERMRVAAVQQQPAPITQIRVEDPELNLMRVANQQSPSFNEEQSLRKREAYARSMLQLSQKVNQSKKKKQLQRPQIEVQGENDENRLRSDPLMDSLSHFNTLLLASKAAQDADQNSMGESVNLSSGEAQLELQGSVARNNQVRRSTPPTIKGTTDKCSIIDISHAEKDDHEVGFQQKLSELDRGTGDIFNSNKALQESELHIASPETDGGRIKLNFAEDNDQVQIEGGVISLPQNNQAFRPSQASPASQV